METKALRYKVELALTGMTDGPSSPYPAPVRLEHLLSLKKAWPTLSWSHDETLPDIPRPTIMGVSGGFFYHASENSDNNIYQWTMELYELRSFRTGRADSHLRYYTFNVAFDIKAVVIDPAQNLLVLVELDEPIQYVSLYFPMILIADNHFFSATHVCARIHFRDLWTCGFHANAPVNVYTLHTRWGLLSMGQCITVKQVDVCGGRVALTVTLETDGGEAETEIVIVDWHKNKAKKVNILRIIAQFY